MIAGDLAVERSSYDWGAKTVGGGGDEESRDEGNFIGIWRRQADGTWKEWCIIWNSWNPAS